MRLFLNVQRSGSTTAGTKRTEFINAHITRRDIVAEYLHFNTCQGGYTGRWYLIIVYYTTFHRCTTIFIDLKNLIARTMRDLTPRYILYNGSGHVVRVVCANHCCWQYFIV